MNKYTFYDTAGTRGPSVMADSFRDALEALRFDLDDVFITNQTERDCFFKVGGESFGFITKQED